MVAPLQASETVTLTPTRALAGVLRAKGEYPRIQECREIAEALAASRGPCGGCVDPLETAYAYLRICGSVLCSEGKELEEWKRVFHASHLRVMLPGQKEVTL